MESFEHGRSDTKEKRLSLSEGRRTGLRNARPDCLIVREVSFIQIVHAELNRTQPRQGYSVEIQACAALFDGTYVDDVSVSL